MVKPHEKSVYLVNDTDIVPESVVTKGAIARGILKAHDYEIPNEVEMIETYIEET